MLFILPVPASGDMNRRAFTLVELLVVIAIIGLLSTVAVVATKSARSRALDTKLLADKNQIIKALNLYYTVNNGWPSTGGNWVCFGADDAEGCWAITPHNGSTALKNAMTSFMAVFPTTGLPVNTNGYNRYLYDYPASISGQTGAFLLWPKTSAMAASECNSAYPPQQYSPDPNWYCYEYLGP
jgi:prepilin-type N-terminal cleavage/methylation domain-containing protein